jgi:Ca2+-transporting ATPase
MGIDQKFPYHGASVDETIEKLNSRKDGLTNEEVENRRREYGENVLPEKGKTSIWKLIIKQFKDFLILILFIAAIISYLTDHMVDVYVIIGVILVNAAIGFFQEFKAEKSIASLKNLIKQKATVIRDKREHIIEAREVVPGDIIKLGEGNSIPADARIMEQKNLRVTEASLTGESVPVDKTTDPIDEDTTLADRDNMIYKGTHVGRGSCKAVVTAIGINTEIGKIAESLQDVEEDESEFRKKTNRLAKIMAIIAVSTAAIVFAIGYFIRDFSFDDILLVTIATLVSSVPEGLPAVLSIVLAIGANRMAKQNAIIREFTATETAGSLNVILTDKTGTITQSVLTVKKLYLPDGNVFSVTGNGYNTQGEIQSEDSNIRVGDSPLFDKVAGIARFCNSAGIEKQEGEEEPSVSGDPTEVSLLVLSKKTNIEETKPFHQVEIVDDLPFNSEQKFRATLISYPDDKKEILVVGAPEKMLELATNVNTVNGAVELDDSKREEIKSQIDQFSSESMRVIGCAYKEADKDMEQLDPEHASELVFTGLFGIIDPPRPEVKHAVDLCKSAGVRVVMVTGDHKQTAAAIAGEVGIAGPEREERDCPRVLTEKDLADVHDDKLGTYTDCVNVFARVSPQVKLRIAQNLQGKNYLIGMTGDGVNDAPALKSADVGIAMGQRGTDVARDASQIVLSDDNFASIVNAIKEGRIVFRNVRQTSFFLITTNFASTLTLIAAIAIGFTYPLMPTQILWINLVTDGIMDISLATEPDHGDIMEQKPLKKGEPILNKQIFPYLLIIAPVMVVLALLVFDYYRGDSVEKARTGVFLVVAMTQVFNAFNLRSLRRSAFSIGFFKNKWLILAFFVSILLQIAAIKLPFLMNIFHFRDLPWADMFVIMAMSSLVFIFGEGYKLLKNRVFN